MGARAQSLRSLGAVAFGVACLSLTSCAKSSPPSASLVARAPTALPAPVENPAATPQGKRRRGEASVYVDGVNVAVLRVLEMPPTLRAREILLSDGSVVPRYAIGDYLTALHVDLHRVRALHLYSGERVSTLSGPELRRLRDRLLISFTQDDRGKPRMVWPREKVDVRTTIDMVTGVAVYVDKEPPVWKNGELVLADGHPADGMPYAPHEQGVGTRVYVDGALTATLKRRTLTNDLLVDGDPASARFSLAAYLSREGALAKGAPQAVDFVVGDDVVDRLDATALKTTAFAMPQHSHGLAMVELPIEAKAARVSAIEVFVRTKPPQRRIVPEAAVVAQGEGGNGGGGGRDPGANANATDEAL